MVSKKEPSANLIKGFEYMKIFDAKYSNERDCEVSAIQLVCPTGVIICVRCGHPHQIIDLENPQRMYICQRCKKEIWVTGNTFFDHVHEFRPYLATVELLEQGITLTPGELRILLEISQTTANSIFKKISIRVAELFESSDTSVPTKRLLNVVMKRSRETPAREHPIEEETAMQKKHDDEFSNQDNSSDPTENAVLNLISGPTSVDKLCEQLNIDYSTISVALTMLELRNLIIRLPGDRYEKCKASTNGNSKGKSDESNNCVGRFVVSFLGFVEEIFQGISRKYLQLYAALFWISIDRERWKDGKLLSFLIRSRHVRRKELRAFVTPLEMKFIMPLTRAPVQRVS